MNTQPDPIGTVLEALSPAERRVALLVADGCTNIEIGRTLGLSTKTVEAHLTSIYRKLRIRSRTELAIRLARAGDDAARSDVERLTPRGDQDERRQG